MAGKVPQMLDVRDESTDVIRIVIECSKGASPEMVMAYLYKNTSLQDSYKVNMTCITPRGPERVNMRQALLDFIDFRHEVTVRRLNHEVRLLSERIHVLEGFVKFTLRVIYKSMVFQNMELGSGHVGRIK